MRDQIKAILVLIAVIIAQSCINEGSYGSDVINIDCDDYITLNLDDYHYQEVLSESPVGTIEHICFIDDEVLIHSGQMLIGFDSASGEEVATFSRRGRANDEYVSLWGFNVGAGSVFIQDLSGGKILRYSSSGELEKVFETQRPSFQAFALLPDGRVVGKRSFEGIPTVELSTWGEDFTYASDIASDSKIESGIMLNYPFSYTDRGEVLYNRYFQNEIYTVHAEEISLRYRIDFGSRNFDQLIEHKDEYDALDLFQESSGRASFISNLNEDSKYITFQFVMSPEGASFAIYEKRTKKTKVFRFTTELVISSIIADRDICYVFAQDAEGKTVYFRYKIDDLLRL